MSEKEKRMAATTFDTLKFSQKLESAGFTHEQAIGASSALAETFADSVATKHDIELVRHDIEILRRDLTIRLGGMMIVASGVIVAGVGVLIKIL